MDSPLAVLTQLLGANMEQLGLLFSGVIGFIQAVLLLMLKNWLKRHDDLDRRISTLEQGIPRVYVTKEEFERNIDRILHRFDKIELKIDRLIDSRKE